MERCPHCGQTHGPDNHFCGVTGQPLDLGPRLLGQVLLDRFEIKTLVGEGPLAVVLGGTDKQAGDRQVAIKMLHPRYARDAGATERFLGEARRVGELGHSGLASVYAVGRDPGGAPVVVREFLTGMCLARFVREHGPLSVELATYVVRSILAALQAVHAAGLYNGDLTADDVFLTSGADGALLVKVLDFGEAHLKRTLVTGGLAGPEATRWWAPEQQRSAIVNERSDIFAVGAMLYLAVTGKVPYPDGIPPAPAVISIPENPSALVPTVNRKIDIVVRRAMSLLPTDRYPTATAFSEALAPFAPAVAPKFADTAGAPARAAAAPVVVPVGLQTTPVAPAPAAKPASRPRPSPKATLMGAPAMFPPGMGPAAPAATEEATLPASATRTAAAPAPVPGPAPAHPATGPVVIPGPEVDQDGATAATLQMPSMADAQPPSAAGAKPDSRAPFKMAEPATESKRGKTLALVIVVLAVVAVVVAVIWFVQGRSEGEKGGAGEPSKAADTVGPAAADAGAAAPADAVPATPEAAADTATPAEPEVAPDAGPAEAAEEVAAEAEEPDVAPETEPETAPAEDDAGAPEAEADETPAVEDAGVPEDAAPEAAPQRDTAASADAAAPRDAAVRRDVVRPRDTTRRRDAGTTQDGRRGVVRDLDF
ncbi:MAG: protein kinase [Deltaproteobacteria bacterium]|nr:protein kinase [Deltaproteobacteria bacterium]